MLRPLIKNALRSCGYSLSRYDYRRDPAAFRQHLLEQRRIDLVLDVGANTGQFANQLRGQGYTGRIVSFEPLSLAYTQLAAAAARDGNWQAEHCALGAEETHAAINIAGNSWSSSLLPMLPRHVESAPTSAYVGTEQVAVHALDVVFDRYCAGHNGIFMKIDTQGFTMEVLKGAQRCLPRITALQLELSLVPLYQGEPLLGEVICYLYERGFRLIQLDPEFVSASGDQLQNNGLFVR